MASGEIRDDSDIGHRNGDHPGAIVGPGPAAATQSGISALLPFRGDYRDEFRSHGSFGPVPVEL